MIHPTRTNLLTLRERAQTVTGSIAILKGRRQALLREFLAASRPLFEAREALRQLYARARSELQLARGREGGETLAVLAPLLHRDLGVSLSEGNVMGLRYRELAVVSSPRRLPSERPYDEGETGAHLEEAIDLFETIVAELLENAAFEGKLRRLAEELVRVTRRIRVLEERLLPELRLRSRQIAQLLEEREREEGYRLKHFKERRGNLH